MILTGIGRQRMRRKGFGSARVVAFIALLASCLLAPLAARAEPVAWISDVRLGKHKDHTRVVMRLDRKLDFQVFTLAEPYRIVIDFPEVGWRADTRNAATSLGLVKGFRYGSYRPGTSRMVLDLAGPSAVVNRFLLPPTGAGESYRLVLDLAPVDREAYLATAGWKGTAATDPAEAEPALRREDPALAPNATPVVVIDPGHGGEDPGAISASGALEEADLVLDVGRRLAENLRKTGRYKVLMTRDEDVSLTLRARVAFARKHGANLFISVHADSAPRSGASGASVYTLSEQASDREAEALARAENQSDIIAGVDLRDEPDIVSDILIDLAQRETKNLSAQFAQLLIPELQKVGNITHRTHRFAGFRVLKAPDVPSVLIELGFLTNDEDETAMRGKQWRRKMAVSIADAVDRYFEQTRTVKKADRSDAK